MAHSTLKTNLPEKMAKRSISLAISVIVIALCVLIGWQFDISFLIRPLPGSKAMNPIAALAFIFASVSFLFLTTGKLTATKLKTGYFFALLVIGIGVIKFLALIRGISLHIDTLLFQNKLGSDRIVPIAAITFMLTGIALLLLHAKTKIKRIISDIILLIISGMSLFSILGYLYQVKIFYGVFTYLPMAIHAAACFLFLSVSMLLFHANQGVMKEITGPYAGGIVARKLIPAAILVPALLGLLRMIGHWTNSFTPEFGVNFLVFTIIIVLMGAIWYSVTLLNKRDRHSKLAEAALKESEEQIQTIFNAAPDAVIIMDQHGYITRWNPKAESVFGWTSDEVMGKPLSEIIIPHRYREAHKKGLKHFSETGEGAVLGKTIEIQAIGKNNIEFDVALSISPTIVNEKYLFIGFIRDITERKKSEEKLLKLSHELEQKVIERTEELAKSEKLFRAMIEKDADMKTLATPEGKVFYASPSLTTILGYENHEFMTVPAFELIHPDDVAGLIEGITDIVRIPGKSFYRQQRLKHKNGTWIWCEGTITNMLHEPAVAALVSNFRDITERKKAEEALQESQQMLSAIINNSAAVIYVKDLQGRYLLANRRFLDLFHLKEADVLGKTDYDFFSKEEAGAFRQMDVRTAAANHPLTGEERAPQDDGIHTYISVKSTLQSANGKPYAIFGISTDITDLKKAQLEIEKLNEELEQKVIDRTTELQTSNKELESFTYSVSHDLRAPLRIIDGYADILVTDYNNKLDEEGNRLLDIIKSNAKRMGQLIDDLLSLSKTGRKELMMRHIDMNKLVRSVIDEQLLLTGNIATVKIENLEPAECDSGLLRQVWINFISNAIKYSREKEKPVIEINSSKIAHEIVYSIKDNGVGFDMKYADKLFGVFQRLHRIDEFEGTGVGLAVVQRIVNKHGGRVWADAEVNKGATFYFSLPASQN